MLFSRSVGLRPADPNPLVQLRAAQNAVLASAPACRRLRFAPGLTSTRRSHRRAGRKACCFLCPTPGLRRYPSNPNLSLSAYQSLGPRRRSSPRPSTVRCIPQPTIRAAGASLTLAGPCLSSLPRWSVLSRLPRRRISGGWIRPLLFNIVQWCQEAQPQLVNLQRSIPAFYLNYNGSLCPKRNPFPLWARASPPPSSVINSDTPV